MIDNPPSQKEDLKKALLGLSVADQNATATFHLVGSATPTETEQLVKEVTARVSKELGREPAKVKTFPNLSSFVVQADPQLLIRLADQSEVKGGSIHKTPPASQPSLIRPVRKYPNNREGWSSAKEPSPKGKPSRSPKK